jgi:molybdopterin-containing oxidoreductase family iron-sulfur binding subunit
MDRRDFMKTAGGAFLLASSGAYAFQVLTRPSAGWTDEALEPSGRKWGMVIDLTRCPDGCTECLTACRDENNVGFFGDDRYDVHWIRKARLQSKVAGAHPDKSVILVCNHCDNPPCAQVCPVQATYKRHDGIVIVDHHRCIGCRYCMIACPYNARYFNMKETEEWRNKNFPKRSHGVAEACNMCAHRLDAGEQPACVEACSKRGGSAIRVGDLNDSNSDISRLITNSAVKRIRPDLGTEPKVYYIGL